MAGVAPRSARSFLGSGMIGQALAHAGGLVPTVERLGTVAPAKSIGPTATPTTGSTSEQEATGSGGLSIELLSGVYVFTGIVRVTYSEDTTGGKVRAEVGCEGIVADASGSGDGGSGTVVSATASGARRLDHAGTVNLTPLLLATTGGAGTVVTTLRATRIADA